MYDRIDGSKPFTINKVESAQKSSLNNKKTNDQALSDYKKKLNAQKSFLEILIEKGEEANEKQPDEANSMKKIK